MNLKRLISAVSIFFVIFSLNLVWALDSEQQKEITIVACSDFQNSDGASAGATQVNKILSAVVNDGVSGIDAFFCCGDYDVDTYGNKTEMLEGINALKTQFSLILSEKDMLFVQGNHDMPAGTNGLAQSGGNDPESDEYGVFVINEDDYMWYNENEDTIKNTAQNLKLHLDEKSNSGYDKPIFILSHLPLHYTARTRDSGDSMHANYIFDVLNDAGKNGLNIIFLFGHNHSGGYDDYLGGSAIYLAKGDEILIAQNSKTEFKTETLNFTYMNAGYVGYYSNMNAGSETQLTMTVFKIKGKEVSISRYSKDGIYLLKAAGVTNAYKQESGYSPNTQIYSSPQTLNGYSSSDEADNSSKIEPITDGSEKTDNTVLYVTVAVILAVAAATIIIIIVSRKRKKN